MGCLESNRTFSKITESGVMLDSNTEFSREYVITTQWNQTALFPWEKVQNDSNLFSTNHRVRLCSHLVYIFIKLTSKYKPIVCALKNYNLNSREKFEPGPGFEFRTSRSLAWRSTTWGILVQLTVQV